MRICLGMIARPVESLLVLCLRPVISHFEGLVVVTGNNPAWTTDVSSLVHSPREFHLFHNVWSHDYSEARNLLIGHAEKLGYDWLMTMDADESMLPDDLITMRKYAEQGLGDNLIIPRYEFVDDFDHYCPRFYPDMQPRLFKLNMGYHYINKVHETLVLGNDNIMACNTPNSLTLAMVHVFHYGKVKPSAEVWLKYNTYDRLRDGLVPLPEVPPGTSLPSTWSLGEKKVRFLANKPL